MAEPENETYTVNPNQKVYDTPHQLDHLVEVVQIYFAEQVAKYKWEPKQDTYTIKGRGAASDVAAKFQNEGRKNIIATPDGEQKETYTAGDTFTVTWEERKEDGFDFNKITKAALKKKVYVVALCNGESGKLSIEIHENKLDNEETVYENPVKFLIGEEEKTKIEFTLNGIQTYAQEIVLRPKSDEDLKKLVEKFEKREDKNAFLFFKAEVSGTDDEIKYADDSQEYINADNQRLEIKFCDCGDKYEIKCTRYSGKYGPLYSGSKKLESYSGWDQLITENKITTEDKEILLGMSENEGNLDSVQSYDWDLSGEKMILTAGAMQKTVDHTGKGEFTTQVKEFKNENPDKYKELFESCGWTIESDILYYKDPSNPHSQKITGNTLSTKIRENCNKDKFGKVIECKPLQPIVNAVIDEAFQAKQVTDFIKRLKDVVLPLVPNGYSYPLSDYLKSKLGKATALDHHINRPGYVKADFKDSLDEFYKSNPNASKNPNEWGENHTSYENEIVEHYGKNRRGTDMEIRYTKMKNNSNLSSQ